MVDAVGHASAAAKMAPVPGAGQGKGEGRSPLRTAARTGLVLHESREGHVIAGGGKADCSLDRRDVLHGDVRHGR